MNKEQKIQVFAWSLSATVAILAIIAWGGDINWKIFDVSTYQLFPVFGLLAFSLMWAHYMASAARQHLNVDREVLKQCFEVTSWLVLVLIFLHPGLLTYQLWRDGLGLPPGSVTKNYVAPGLGWVVVLAEVSLLIFLAYELRRWFDKKSWWKYVQYSSDAAMLAIFYHGLRLGGQLQGGWFRYLWFFYGITLFIVLIYKYFRKLSSNKS